MSGLGLENANRSHGFEPIPAGTTVELVMRIKPGDIGLDNLCKQSSNGDSEGLDVEYVVKGGEFDGRKLFTFHLLDGVTAGHAKAGEITRSLLRAIFEAIHAIDPNDNSPATIARRASASLAAFNGATFLAELAIERGGKKPNGGVYPDKNKIGRVLRPGDQGYRKARATTAGAYRAFSTARRGPTRRRRPWCASRCTDDDCQTRMGAMIAAGRKIGVPTLEAIDAIWQRRATAAAILAVREMIRDGGAISPATPISQLGDVELGWLAAASLFAWIKTRAEQATANGWDTELTLRLTGLDPEPWNAGAVESILPELGALPDVDWSRPITSWPKDQMVRFLLEALRLISAAMIARGVGGGITTKGKLLEEMQRVAAAEAGGPLMTPDELNDPIGF